MGIAPTAGGDEDLAAHIVIDVTDSDRGWLPEGPIAVEARFGAALRRRLSRRC